MIGLKRGTVKLCEHEKEWEIEAQNTIFRLKKILGNVANDIQHVGSTAIPSIKAKPIIDIAVAVDDFNDVIALEKELKDEGFYYRPQSDLRGQLLFASGSLYEGTGDLQTHFIHVVRTNSMDWINYINFRDYLNSTPTVAKEYEELKVSLAMQAPIDSGREKYLKGKHDFIVYTLRKALVKSYLGKKVDIKIDRPIGYVHKKENYSLTYPINYGYIPSVLGGDGEELDVYLLGVNEPVIEYKAQIIGIAHRENDVEDKLIASPIDKVFYQNEIAEAIHFQEQYYKTTVESIYEKSAGAVLYTVLDDKIKYLLIKSQNGDIGFPKGHIEHGENEEAAALREIYEETYIKAELTGDFKAEIEYTMPNGKSKTVIYFTAVYANQTPKHNDGFEHNEYMLLEYDVALNSLTFENTKEILTKVNEFINNCKD
ncbi:MAG: GrpB family protein [Acutalibacteraceae bacterium]|nr:GrpB family protein [Acutalibacteraceae bacterium]